MTDSTPSFPIMDVHPIIPADGMDKIKTILNKHGVGITESNFTPENIQLWLPETLPELMNLVFTEYAQEMKDALFTSQFVQSVLPPGTDIESAVDDALAQAAALFTEPEMESAVDDALANAILMFTEPEIDPVLDNTPTNIH